MPEQSQILCRNACIDCGAAIPVPLRRATNGGPMNCLFGDLGIEWKDRTA